MIRIVFLGFFLLLPFRLYAEEFLSLDDCYKLAKTQSEALARRVEDIRAAEARYDQAVAQLLPSVHFLAIERLRDNNPSRGGGSSSNDDEVTTTRRSNVEKNQFETIFNVQQPIFSGFRDIYLSQAAKAETSAFELEKRRADELLYQDVSEVFYQILLYKDDLRLLGRTEDILQQRLKELRHFIDLGRSRESELISAQTDVADVDALRQSTIGLLGASNELLAFLTGIPAEQLKLAPSPQNVVSPTLATLLEQATQRFDIQAAQARQLSQEKVAKAAEREAWPNISLQGDYYPYQDPENNRELEVQLRFDLPLYEGGAMEARVAEERARLHASSLTVHERKRIAESEVRTAYNNVTSAQAQVKSLKALLDSTRKDYDSQRSDYELGVVTNLDVLQAIRSVADAERRLNSAQTTLNVNRARLSVATGGIQ